MTQKCKVCELGSKTVNQLEKDYVDGMSKQNISKKYDVPYGSVDRHLTNHLSTKIAESGDMENITNSLNILDKIDDVLEKATEIFERNYRKKRDGTALKALTEKRNTLELLSKISWALHQAKADELQTQQLSMVGQSDEIIAEALQYLTKAEKDTLFRLQMKMINKSDEVIIPDDEQDEEPDWEASEQDRFKRNESDEQAEQYKETAKGNKRKFERKKRVSDGDSERSTRTKGGRYETREEMLERKYREEKGALRSGNFNISPLGDGD